LFTIVLLACVSSREIQRSAELNAEAYCAKLWTSCIATTCVSDDVNHDHFVPCTLLRDNNQTDYVVCAYKNYALQTLIRGQPLGCY
jgi:hypothetical protein